MQVSARMLQMMVVVGLVVGCCRGGDIRDGVGATQKAAVKQKIAADEAAINPKTLGKMLQDGFSIPAILSTITKEHGLGACCQAALVIGGAGGSHELEAMLRQDPQDYSSDKGGVEGTVRLLASRAGTCCRGSLCTSLRSQKQCDWLGTCRWHPSRIAAADGKTGLCKEVTKAQLLAPTGNTAMQRTKDYMKQELAKKEEELKKSDLKLAQEEEELSAEKEISRMTAAARSLFKQGKFSEAKRYLEEAVRLDSSKTVQHIPGTSSDASHRHGLLDLQTAASILDELRCGISAMHGDACSQAALLGGGPACKCCGIAARCVQRAAGPGQRLTRPRYIPQHEARRAESSPGALGCWRAGHIRSILSALWPGARQVFDEDRSSTRRDIAHVCSSLYHGGLQIWLERDARRHHDCGTGGDCLARSFRRVYCARQGR